VTSKELITWVVTDPLGHSYDQLAASTYDQAIINVLSEVLPEETYGKIRWGRVSRGPGALYYLWIAMIEHGWTVNMKDSSNA
jgi:hypothetical protein